MSLSPVSALPPDVSMVDFPGRMAAMLYTRGCNFRCGFCHNGGLWGEAREGLAWEEVRERLARHRENWVEGAVVTGGEPTLQEGLGELIGLLRDMGFAVKLDTNGSRPDVLEAMLGRVAYVAMDVKCAPEEYPERTGWGDTGALEKSLAVLKGAGKEYELRTTVIRGWHGEAALRAMGAWAAGAKRWIVQPFIPREHLPDAAMRGLGETTGEELETAAAILREYAGEVRVRGGW
jgi:pyruvate formate lyase activating enzyme